ncbi:MAG TPA: pinensin family lanthipeptide [Longimicrobium sp.]|nr:pinensin family lanthipeptide [Longimicrobium sp.]
MPRKLTLDDLQVESFVTTEAPAARGTVFGAETDAIYGGQCGGNSPGCAGGESNECPGPSDQPCTWYQVFTCETNQIAYPSECTGCGVDCNPTYDWCPSGPGYEC